MLLRFAVVFVKFQTAQAVQAASDRAGEHKEREDIKPVGEKKN